MSFFGSFLKRNPDYTNLDTSEFQKLIGENNSVIIDVRTEEEFSEKRIPNALLFNIYKPDFIEKIGNLERGKKYLVYCKAGSRSAQACRHMVSLGFQNVYNLEKGITGWDGEVVKG
jgi:rhodanese-related sulfurtransferase